MNIILKRSNKKEKKYTVIFENPKQTIHFGSASHENYTVHKDRRRKQLYIIRHRKRENWNKSGIRTAGFWSRWLLWNKPTLEQSIKNIEKNFNVRILKSFN